MNESAGFYCDARALSNEERVRYGELTSNISRSRAKTTELDDGYAFQLEDGSASIADLAEWVSYERKCCPFFTFEIELAKNDGPLWLKLRGAEGVKPFIRVEFAVSIG